MALGLMAIEPLYRFFSHKIAGNRLTIFFCPQFWTKIALFFGKYCNSQDKIPTDKLLRDMSLYR